MGNAIYNENFFQENPRHIHVHHLKKESNTLLKKKEKK